jgi:hypothetical protein
VTTILGLDPGTVKTSPDYTQAGESTCVNPETYNQQIVDAK